MCCTLVAWRRGLKVVARVTGRALHFANPIAFKREPFGPSYGTSKPNLVGYGAAPWLAAPAAG
jgi:hypothetical protein